MKISPIESESSRLIELSRTSRNMFFPQPNFEKRGRGKVLENRDCE